MSEFRRRLMMAQRSGGSIPNYLCFTALEECVFTLSIPASLSTTNLNYVEYSTDEGRTWTKTNNIDSTAVTITTPTIYEGESVLWRGDGIKYGTSTSEYSRFSSTGNFDMSGKIMSLTVGKDCDKTITSIATYIFIYLFYNNTKLINAKDCIFPDVASGNCYNHMFYQCSNLKTPPVIENTAGAGGSSFVYMFGSCSKLEYAPIMRIKASGRTICSNMFRGCTSLTSAPELLCETLGYEQYRDMFTECRNSNFNYIKMLGVDVSQTRCLGTWLSYVQDVSGVFVKHINATWTTTGSSGVPTNWTIIYYDSTEDKYYTSQDQSQECDDHGNPI